MSKNIEVVRPQGFKWAEKGIHVTEYLMGEVLEVGEGKDCSEECAQVALDEKWAKETSKPRERVAPETTEADTTHLTTKVIS